MSTEAASSAPALAQALKSQQGFLRMLPRRMETPQGTLPLTINEGCGGLGKGSGHHRVRLVWNPGQEEFELSAVFQQAPGTKEACKLVGAAAPGTMKNHHESLNSDPISL